VCVDIRTIYDSGLTGGRGGNGQLWRLVKRSGTGEWKLIWKFVTYNSD
jgi:hypothetical protein